MMPHLDETPTRFLLARLAEDEASATDPRSDGYQHGRRILAEASAKRRIVALALNLIASFGDWDGPDAAANGGIPAWPDVTRRERAHAHELLGIVAETYSDHPDYQQHWGS